MSFLHSRNKQIYPKSSASDRFNGFNAISDDVSEDQKVILTIDDHGKICDCNQTGGKLLECLPSELIGLPISHVLPALADIKLFQGTQSIPELLFLSRIDHRFEVMRMFGASFTGYLFFSDMTSNQGQHLLRVIICPVKQTNV